MAKRKNTKIKVTGTYLFVEKDPVIDIVRTFTENEARRRKVPISTVISEACSRAPLSPSTPANWFFGDTRRPISASVESYGRALGYRRKWVRL
jgi:hypothetical protein